MDGQRAVGIAQGPTGDTWSELWASPSATGRAQSFHSSLHPPFWDPKSRSSSGEPDHRNPRGGLLETHFSYKAVMLHLQDEHVWLWVGLATAFLLVH